MPRPRHIQQELALDVAVATVFSTWSENDLLTYVRRTAKMLGWMLYHTRFSLKSDAGFPDLVLVKDRIVYAELKRENKWPTEGRLSNGIVPRWVNGQREWITALAQAGAEVYIWWPSDSRDIADILMSGATEAMACVTRTRDYLAAPEGGVSHGAAPPTALETRRRGRGPHQAEGITLA
jgi:hypothetical protein